MKILFITDNFPPEVNAPATRTFEHCKEWINLGAAITVITCFPNFPRGKVYDGYKNRLYAAEWIDGIKVIRVWTYIAPNKGFFKRIVDYLSFCVSSFIAGLFIKTDIIVATSPQFFTAVSACFLSFLKRKPWVFEVRDLWPESIKAVQVMKRDNFIFDLLEKLELFMYKKANLIVVVTDTFKKNIIERGINQIKIKVIKNGSNFDSFYPRKKNEIIINELGLQKKFIVGYIGTHGLAHKLDFIIESILTLNDNNLHFLFIGDGAEKENLVQLAKAKNVSNLTFLNSVAKEKVAEYLSILDVGLVHLRKTDTFKKVIPSKIFELCAMQRPILLGVEGESKILIEDYNAGLCFEPENESEFLEKLKQIKSDTSLYFNFQKGCEQLAKDHNRKTLAKYMYELLNLEHQK